MSVFARLAAALRGGDGPPPGRRPNTPPRLGPPRRNMSWHRAAGPGSGMGTWPAEANLTRTPAAGLQQHIDRLRGRSRYAVDNVPLARSALLAYWTGILSPAGPTLDPMPGPPGGPVNRELRALIRRDWRQWASGRGCDFQRGRNLLQLLQGAVHHLVADGEAFVRLRPGAPLSLELVDPQRCPAWIDHAQGGWRTIMGVRINKHGRVLGYILNPVMEFEHGPWAHYPRAPVRNSEFVPVRGVKHWMMPSPAGSYRGAPALRSALQLLSTLGQYDEAALKTAQKGADTLGILQSGETALGGDLPGASAFEADHGDALADPAEGEEAEPVVMGRLSDDDEIRFLEVPPGTDMRPFQTAYPDWQFDAFTSVLTDRIAAAAGLAPATLTGNLKGLSFSAGRMGGIKQADWFRTLRGGLEADLLGPIYRSWLSRRQMTGHLPDDVDFADLSQHRFLYASPAPIDAAKDAAAQAALLAAQLRSARQLIAEAGLDPDEVMAQIDEEGARAKPDAKPEPDSDDDSDPDADVDGPPGDGPEK